MTSLNFGFNLLIVSIGTGTPNLSDSALAPEAMHLLYHAQNLPRALLSSARQQQDLLCRVFGDCLVGEPLDLEVGDLIGASGPANPKLFTYLRYDVSLTAEGLEKIGCGHHNACRLGELDDIMNLTTLQEVGKMLAEARVQPNHFARFLPDMPNS